MNEEIPLTADQLAMVLDGSPMAVYVTALDNYELLYANQQARELLPQEELRGILCCQAEAMSSSRFFVREVQAPANGRIYQLSGKLIDWSGRPAHIEYALDVTEKKAEEGSLKTLREKLEAANEKMQDIINAIPGGVAVYKVSDLFETVYFSDGVPALTGYSAEEYRELAGQDGAAMTCFEDAPMVVRKVREIVDRRGSGEFEFRKQHRDGHFIWIRAQVKWIGEEEGCPLVHCVFYNITALKEAQLEMDHLINSIPGGIASYRSEGGRFLTEFLSEGMLRLSGHTREEYDEICRRSTNDMVYELDRERVLKAGRIAYESGEVLDISYRIRHKNGSLIWVHLNGRRMGPLSEGARFYAVFTGMSAEARLFRSIANRTADGIYVIDRSNYDLLYTNETRDLFLNGADCLGQKCYAALHKKNSPCGFCTLKTHAADGKEHVMEVDGTHRYYKTRFWETDWNGIPAYVKYMWDVTEEVNTRLDKERLEMYFKNVVDKLPGGILVIRCEADGHLAMEFISGGFAAMLRMTEEETKKLYKIDAFMELFLENAGKIRRILLNYVQGGGGQCEITSPILCGDGGHIWMKGVLSLKQTSDGVRRIYASCTDITKTVEEKEKLRRQYEELILRHYRAPGPDALIVGHFNITRNRILEIIDYTDSELLKSFGTVQEEFFTGLAGLVEDPEERQAFLAAYLNGPALDAFLRKDTELIQTCFVRFPKEKKGRYVRFKVDLVETPDTGDITGILTATDITEQTISDRILHQLSVANYDFVIDLDLEQDAYRILTSSQSSGYLPTFRGRHSRRIESMLDSAVVPKDREQVKRCLDPVLMRGRLEREGLYTFSFSITDQHGDIRTKNMTVFAIDLRLGRVCLLRTDITDSVREQQGLLNMMAYTFERMCILYVNTNRFIMYTRQMVLENLPPQVTDGCSGSTELFTDRLETMLKRLEEEPSGYDFVIQHQTEEGLRYKQINVLWGDSNHNTVCMVQADVTDMLTAERKAKKTLEKALALAEEANQAKSNFLSAMSHDIRTPMNAIMGMTALAIAHMDDRNRVADCLQKITISSNHLLSLINDILDMSKIERSKIMLNSMRISVSELLDQLSAIIAPQARSGGLRFAIRTEGISHEYFYGDSLRISQILINILSNAVKFTPEGGRVDFLVEELPPKESPKKVRYRFTVSDTGIGMPEEFLKDVFAPFARSEGASRIEGTGLGLSITKGLVELMGGSLSVESKPGAGSAFRVELECGEAEAAEAAMTGQKAPEGAENPHQFEGRCFLMAEDNAINAEIISELLSMEGAEIVIRTDGVQAVKEFKEKPPGTYDAVLMDIQMPEMNGYEATRRIRELDREDAEKIPIIAMTANAFSEDVQASLAAGMTAHVAKPIDVSLLKSTLRQVMGMDENGQRQN